MSGEVAWWHQDITISLTSPMTCVVLGGLAGWAAAGELSVCSVRMPVAECNQQKIALAPAVRTQHRPAGLGRYYVNMRCSLSDASCPISNFGRQKDVPACAQGWAQVLIYGRAHKKQTVSQLKEFSMKPFQYETF